VLEVRYEWSFCSWAVRSKPTATDIPHPPHSYLNPNRGSLQKPVGGRVVLPQKHAKSMQKTPATYLKPNSQSLQKTRRGVYPTQHQFNATYSIYRGAIDCSERNRGYGCNVVASWIKVVFGVKTYISLFGCLLLTIKAKP
jgi:hypothetical protein